MASYVPVADAIGKMANTGYRKIACGGFSAGCDMLLRAILFTPAHCDMLVLQSPWIPCLQDHAEALVNAVRQKNIALRVFCGSEDEDCLPMAQQLFEVMNKEGISVALTVQKGNRHQFPEVNIPLNERL